MRHPSRETMRGKVGGEIASLIAEAIEWWWERLPCTVSSWMPCQRLQIGGGSPCRPCTAPPASEQAAGGSGERQWGRRGGGGSEVAGAAASITTASPLSLSSPLFSLFLFLFLFPSLFPSFYLSLPLSLSLSSYIFIFLAGRGWPVGGASG